MPRAACGLALLACAVAVALGALPAIAANEAEATRRASDIPEVAEILEDKPGTRLIAHSRDDDGWTVELISDDAELGFVVLSDDLDLVRVALSAEPERADRDDPGEVTQLIPRPEGPVFLWVATGLALYLLQPTGGWAGRLVVGAIVPWSLAWYLFWENTAWVQALFWLTNLTVLVGLSVAAVRGHPPMLGTRSSPRRSLFVLAPWAVILALAGSAIEDSAIWGSIGGRYFIENLTFPYGTLGEGATYGPMQYLLHSPLTLIWPPGEIGVDSFTAARVVAAIAFGSLILSGLAALGRRSEYARSGMLAVAVLPWFLSVVDVANVSHLVPITFTVAAFYMIGKDDGSGTFWAGSLLGLGASAMFVPIFALPALVLTARRRWRAAVLGFSVVGIFVLGMLFATGTDISTLWDSTVGFQESVYAAEGGLSVWGQWGLENWRWAGKVLHGLLIGVSAFALYLRPGPAMGFLAAGIGIGGILLWKGHVGPWGYLTWFVPLLVIGAILTSVEEEPALDRVP